MPGGLLNLISYGNQNIILNGNPSKTFFKSVYAKYSNFGLQNIRIDFNGQKTLKLNEDSQFNFKIPRNAELLLDTFLVFNIPDIWSPVVPPQQHSDPNETDEEVDIWKPYHFKWIEYLGTSIIKNITLTIGSLVIQSYSGQYIQNMIEREFDSSKKELFYKMIGHIAELNNPAKNIFNSYPNAAYKAYAAPNLNVGPDTSIRGRKIYVPLHLWFSTSSKMALPLVCLQYSEVNINITLRPINDLYRINNVSVSSRAEFKYNQSIRPNINDPLHSFYRFIQPPPNTELEYSNTNYLWDTDIHLIGKYCFLSEEEATIFAKNEQTYLIKDIKEDIFPNIVGTKKVKIISNGMACTWMWKLQRSDIKDRNEWSNYTNWPYTQFIYDLLTPEKEINGVILDGNPLGVGYNINKFTFNNSKSYIVNHDSRTYITPDYDYNFKKEILRNISILFDGKFRENTLDSGIYSYIEKYNRCNGGNLEDGLYVYNYCLHSSPYDLQPSGAINLSKFKTIEIEFETHNPPLDTKTPFYTICDALGQPIGNTKPLEIYKYTYNLLFTEERYNILRFISGQAGLLYAR